MKGENSIAEHRSKGMSGSLWTFVAKCLNAVFVEERLIHELLALPVFKAGCRSAKNVLTVGIPARHGDREVSWALFICHPVRHGNWSYFATCFCSRVVVLS